MEGFAWAPRQNWAPSGHMWETLRPWEAKCCLPGWQKGPWACQKSLLVFVKTGNAFVIPKGGIQRPREAVQPLLGLRMPLEVTSGGLVSAQIHRFNYLHLKGFCKETESPWMPRASYSLTNICLCVQQYINKFTRIENAHICVNLTMGVVVVT